MTLELPTKPFVIAHRGASADAPENTLMAFETAAQQSAQWIECDVCLSKDDVPIIIHDHTLQRTTNRRGRVGNFTWSELKELDAGSWFDPEFSDATIPSLKDVVQCARQHKLTVNLELKPQRHRQQALITAVLNDIDVESCDVNILFSSFDMTALQLMRQQVTSAPLACLFHHWNRRWLQHATELNALSVNVNVNVLTESRVKAIRDAGFYCMAYTVNDSAQAQRLFQLGVNAVFSDHAALLTT